MSKLEEALAQQLDLMGKDERWPFPAPVREFHPMWCCEHLRGRHTRGLPNEDGVSRSWQGCHGCIVLAADEAWPWHAFKRERNWRVDFAWPDQRVIVECEGIRFDAQGGRHQTGIGFERDLEKYTALRLAGWDVIRVSRREITSGEALAMIEQALRKSVEA